MYLQCVLSSSLLLLLLLSLLYFVICILFHLGPVSRKSDPLARRNLTTPSVRHVVNSRRCNSAGRRAPDRRLSDRPHVPRNRAVVHADDSGWCGRHAVYSIHRVDRKSVAPCQNQSFPLVVYFGRIPVGNRRFSTGDHRGPTGKSKNVRLGRRAVTRR